MGAVTATITSDGTQMPPEYELLVVDVVKEINRIPYARLKLVDGDAPEQQYPISDGEFFNPGKEIEIKLRYEGKADQEATVFKGLVVKQTIRSDSRGSYLNVEMRDAAIKMTSMRRTLVYTEKSDDAIFKEMIDLYPKLTAGHLAATGFVHKESVQYYATDWDYMLNRADVNGLVVACNNGEISVLKPALVAAKHTINHGVDDVVEMEMEIDSRYQFADILATTWSDAQQEMSKPSKAVDFALKQGDQKAKELATVVNEEPYLLKTSSAEHPKAAQAWANAMMQKTRLAMLKGTITTYGKPNVALADCVDIVGIGNKFNGTALLTGLRHRVNVKGWYTDMQFGLSNKWFSQQTDIDEEPASGLMPAIHGLHFGVVQPFAEDPDKLNRVRVQIPAFGDSDGVVWARLALPDAGVERGTYFYPEPNDEVVLGFINDDPRQAVILGSLHNATNKPPFVTTTENSEKGMRTKGGCELSVNDEALSVHIKTSDKQQILVDEKNKTVAITDVNGNQVTLDKNGITLKSAKDLNLEAAGNVTIKGAKVDIK